MVLVQTTLEGARLEIQKLENNIESAKASVVELNSLLTTYLSLARRFGLPDDIMNALAKIQQLITIIRTLRLSLILLQTATGPIGWLTAAGSLAIGGMMASDFLMDLG